MSRARRPAGLALGCIVLACLVLVAACEAGTGGRRVRFEMAVEPSAPRRPMAFHTAAGWDVTLREACISIGPVYLYANPFVADVGPRRLPQRLHDWLVPSAHAHPGVDHFNGGEVRGEWLDQLAVDLLADRSVALGSFEGIAGHARSVTIGVHPPGSAARGAVACLRGHQVYVAGAANRAGTTIAFEGGLDIEEAGNRRRMQVAADLLVDDGTRVVISIEPRRWLDQADFDQLAVDPTTGVASITPESQVRGAWWLGIQSAGAFGAWAHEADSP